MDGLIHLGIYKGGVHSETSADLVYSQGEHVLRGSITLCPWCQRGRMKLKFLRLPSSPKGEIVGIMAKVLYLMATPMAWLSIWWELKSLFMWRKVHGILCREKFISCGKTYLWSMVVSPWNLNIWFLDHGISTDVLIPSIELMVLVCYGFGPWYWSMIWGRACLYKAKEIIWLEHLLSDLIS